VRALHSACGCSPRSTGPSVGAVFGGCVLVAVALLRVGGGRLHSLKQTVVESMHRRRNKRAYTRITPRRARGTTEGAAPAALKYESMWRPRAGSSLLGAFRLLYISLAPGIVPVLLDHFVRARSKFYLYYMPPYQLLYQLGASRTKTCPTQALTRGWGAFPRRISCGLLRIIAPHTTSRSCVCATA
jgi:hypothetical protein